MSKTIALDIGGVCVRLNPERALKELDIADMEGVPVEFAAATDMLEKGFITDNEWLNIFSYLTENKFSHVELRAAWGKIIGEAVEGMPELAKELVETGCRLIFFSDTSEIHMQEVYRNLSFANLVTGCIFSYEVGAKKPDERMYDAFEKIYGRPVFFVDDREANVEGGKRYGWNSHLFSSAEDMRRALVEAGVL